MRYVRLLLFPFSLLYHLVTHLRNWFYDNHFFKSFDLEVATISVGNITVGGTGKTPVVEYLIRLRKEHNKIVTLSRGYKRKTNGFILAGKEDDAKTIGDEPFQYFNKFHNEIGVSVCEDRLFAIPHILSSLPETDLILLDDAYQHRKIKPTCNILLTDYNRPFYDDMILPAGNLRESKNNANRADVIIVTKCPDELGEEEIKRIDNSISRYSRRNVPVFFMNIQYGIPEPVFNNKSDICKKVILVTAIAEPKPLVDFIDKNYHLVKHFNFADHHYFSGKNLKRIIEFYKSQHEEGICIIFSEKDIMRIAGTDLQDILMDYPVFFQPITYKFAQNESDFDEFIQKVLDKTED
jgi:tetraacyldisaccharide 4'-kinase